MNFLGPFSPYCFHVTQLAKCVTSVLFAEVPKVKVMGYLLFRKVIRSLIKLFSLQKEQGKNAKPSLCNAKLSKTGFSEINSASLNV